MREAEVAKCGRRVAVAWFRISVFRRAEGAEQVERVTVAADHAVVDLPAGLLADREPLGGGGTPGEGAQRAAARRDGAGYVGVEPVADREGVFRVCGTDGLVHQRGRGLAGDDRLATGGRPERGDEGPVAREHAALGGQ